MQKLSLSLPVATSDKKAFYVPFLSLLFVLCVPILALALNWHWSPERIPVAFSSASYWVSESMPFIGVGLLCLALFKLPISYRQKLLLFGVILVLLCIGAGVKSVLKNVWQEPRPYAVWLQKQSESLPPKFYALSNVGEYISKQDLSKTAISPWQQEYWAKNTGFSFPSGHALFAMQVLLMILAVLWHRRVNLLGVVTTLWVIAVLFSRLFLGMHWPVDLLFSSVIALLLNVPFLFFCRNYLFLKSTFNA